MTPVRAHVGAFRARHDPACLERCCCDWHLFLHALESSERWCQRLWLSANTNMAATASHCQGRHLIRPPRSQIARDGHTYARQQQLSDGAGILDNADFMHETGIPRNGCNARLCKATCFDSLQGERNSALATKHASSMAHARYMVRVPCNMSPPGAASP